MPTFRNGKACANSAGLTNGKMSYHIPHDRLM